MVPARPRRPDREVPSRHPRGLRAASRDFPRFTARYLDDRSATIVEALAIAAQGLGVSAAEVALAWVRDRPGVVSPIVGARTRRS